MTNEFSKEFRQFGTDITPPNPETEAEIEEVTKRIFPHYPGKEQIDTFFKTLGRAISVWQLVETALYEVYERAVAPSRPGACGASFHALQAFNVKLSATNAAVKFAVHDNQEALSEWDRLFNKAHKKATRRNELVHFGTIVMYDEERPNEKVKLEPLMHDYRHLKERPARRLTDIVLATQGFSELERELADFKWRIPHANPQ